MFGCLRKNIDEIDETHSSRERQRQSRLPTTNREKSQLRGVLVGFVGKHVSYIRGMLVF